MPKNSIKQDENINNISNKDLLIRLFSYLKPYKLRVFLILILLIYVMLCGLLNPYLMKIAIDKYISSKNLQGLILLAIAMFILNFLSMIASKTSIQMLSKVTNKILLKIRQQLYEHIQKLSFSFFDNRPVGKILARVIGDVNSLQELFSTSLTSFIPEILTLICVTFIMFYMNFVLALMAIIVIPFLSITLFSIETISRKRWQNYRRKRSNLNAYTHEDFSGIKIIQGFSEEEKTSRSFLVLTKDMMDSFVKAVRLNDSFWPIVTLSSGVGTILVFFYGISLLKSNRITIGTMVAFIAYISMFWRPIINISNFYNTLITNFAAGERIFEILDIKPDITTIKNDIMPKITGTVEFKDLTFSYNNDATILNKLNFKIYPGETVALVGPTGSGKTTIVNLISRFYDPTKGSVLIDNINIKYVNLESLRSQMGIMLQDTFLFSSTIMENIRYGKLDATDEEVIAASKSANAHAFIMNLENSYNTEVNERGSRLSVGQRQLISFARALLANPRILILDEATSNIDTHTEKLVQSGIQKLLTGRTSFVIAHRLSTIRNADRIMVIDKGNIAESGTHKELMKLKGLYYDLFMSQYKFLD
ncbi:ABC-type multidrug transport system, ATPase and permease component [Clostridium pasteurianum DSM 525 = ATCC 6013]|uniref:ABC-type multidrug transport system, ATPase and permease component n=1 Tax=Clostridium pasteurianum DSM 525 = ATCC 6013 TaxID=1262449 RepID=A0A0H3J7A7_CLOPA|nr:ABC transporter transmembrane domain-containing protein [Clostridium pasteurianum]AJA49796.1 ABC-type multidrug transport system, ATPase and permease component [Clostridium pasteurianum DSM 525 = ATCC 6013]AJA53784.1 ABC-type multidrug transport system, ATPase and permease component [Clostridium pasteurianum DSM 525 = ATCC 6013]AOZ76947.1 multidrug ABC transporter ATP-binding protein [Clostridium pasteurianum DSM 525 = ATCC 6013]AOZ80744.1 multidrug ABC transporter ATP-binding protein [Clost